jgi:hypothetical protein
MIEGMQRALDVSFLESTLVPIGGREYTLSPQSAPQLERVLNAIYDTTEVDLVPETATEKKTPWGTVVTKNFTRSLPVLAMMFSYDPKSPEGKQFINHLNEFMVPKLAVKVYQEWRRINDIDDFLLRTGKPLLHPDLVVRLQALKMQEVDEILSASDLATQDRVLAETAAVTETE